MDTTISGPQNLVNMNEFDLDILNAIVKRSDRNQPCSESIFNCNNNVNKYDDITLNFTDDHILALLDEIIFNKERSGEDSQYSTEKTFTSIDL